MQQTKLDRRAVIAAAAVFLLLLGVGFWWKLNPASGQAKEAYYRDAARLQAEEAGLGEGPAGANAPAPAVPSDKAYQPETGNID